MSYPTDSDSKSDDQKEEDLKEAEKKYDKAIVDQYIRAYEEYAAKIIAPYLDDMTEEDFLQKIRQDGVERKLKKIVLSKSLPEDKVVQLKQAIHEARLLGFKFEATQKRFYSVPDCLTHVLGYVGQMKEGSSELSGVAGIEAKYDSYLSGTPGVREMKKGPKGQYIPFEGLRMKEAQHGKNIKLTIDMGIQTIVEEELDKGLAHFHSVRGTIIVVEPTTGSILAMASRPHFNLNTKENMQEGALNFAVQGLYEPGSTFKVVAVTSAVDSGKATFNTIVDCNPKLVKGTKKPVSDAPRGALGFLPVKAVLWKSSNPGAYAIGLIAGWPTYKKYMEAFGFKTKTGIDLPSESKGQSQDGSNIVNFSRITFGYSVTATPLQVVMAYAAIANGGMRMKPRLVSTIYDSSGAVYEECKPQELGRVMKKETAAQLCSVLAGVTAPGGTATKAAVDGYKVGGKTGTAHKVRESGGYYDDKKTVSFVGIFPAENPAFVCLVVVDDPHPTDCRPGGGTVCAPIFKNVATRLASALNIPKEGSISGAAANGNTASTANNQSRGNARR